MATDEEVSKLREKTFKKICEFYARLEQEGLIIKNDSIVKGSIFQIILRMTKQQKSLDHKMKLLENKLKFKQFLDANKEFGITEDSFMFDLSCDMAHFLHSEMESIPRFLVEILNPEKITVDKEKPMLGAVLKQLALYRDSSNQPVFNEEGLRAIFGVAMRNALGHDKWWFDNQGRFCYEDEEPFTFGDFAGEMMATSLLIEALNTKYLKKYFSESLNQVTLEDSESI